MYLAKTSRKINENKPKKQLNIETIKIFLIIQILFYFM